MKTTKKQMYDKIMQHGENLNKIFNTGIDNITLCKKLLKIERKAHRATTNLCNTNNLYFSQITFYDLTESTEQEIDIFFDAIRKSVIKILGEKSKECTFINFDPRGYAIKIKDTYIKENNIRIEQDWGGYGIIAPDFNY